MNSVSRIPIMLEIIGKGLIKAEFLRHLSPITISHILKKLPLSGRIHKFGSTIPYIETGLMIGAEKQKKNFSEGDLTFMVTNGSICVIIEKTSGISMNHLGHLNDNLEILNSTIPGDIMSIKKR